GDRHQPRRHRGPDPRLHHGQPWRGDGNRAAGHKLGHLRGRPARCLLVLLPVVLPRAAHGNAWPHVRRAEGKLNMLCRLGLALTLAAVPLLAAEVAVVPGRGTLAAAIAGASPGDVLTLTDGAYLGPVTIDRPLVGTGPDRAG